MFCGDPDPYLTIMYDFNRDKEDIIGYEIYKQKNTLRKKFLFFLIWPLSCLDCIFFSCNNYQVAIYK